MKPLNSSPQVVRGLFPVPRSVLSNRLALVLILGEFVVGTVGYMWLEGYTFRQAFFMTTITVATVGYGAVKELSPAGEWFSSFLILLNIGIFAYALAVFSYYVINGEIFRKMHLKSINNKIDSLRDHVIVCGYGRYGREVSQNFMHHRMPFVVVENSSAIIEEMQSSGESILYIGDDATHDETLLRAGITRAKALITALPDDSENVFIVLTARQLNPTLNIISRATQVKSQRKLRLAGANHVIMPEQIGGFYMATLVSKPGATEFFSYITRESESDIEFEEIHFRNMPPSCKGKSISDLHIRRETGANIIGFKHSDGSYVVNPGPETILEENSSFILLGNREQLESLRQYLARLS
ncbi:MAG: NAD-binding protein [Saprospiraceae bacterium]|jgi:voltage-gated potassium channel|nr:NAD-binding protein [Saprospiraceae bacterium]